MSVWEKRDSKISTQITSEGKMTSETTRVRRETIGAAITDDLFSLTFIPGALKKHSESSEPCPLVALVKRITSSALSRCDIISLLEHRRGFQSFSMTFFDMSRENCSMQIQTKTEKADLDHAWDLD